MTAVDFEAATVLDELPGIDLAELVARGELLTRVDRKYVLHADAAASLADRLAGQAQVLAIDGVRSFDYASLYFDTPDLASYRMAAHRRRRRFKVRRRTYLDTGTSFLEVKYVGRRGATVKERREDAGLAADAPFRHLGFLAATLERAGVEDRGADLWPVLQTRYRRRTLFLPESSARLTIDTDLQWQLPSGAATDFAGLVVVETKSAGAPSLADRLLWADGRRPDRISKYCTGLALLAPTLPANRWHRVLHDLTQPTHPRTTS